MGEWFKEERIETPEEALKLIKSARLKWPDFAMALKYVSQFHSCITGALLFSSHSNS